MTTAPNDDPFAELEAELEKAVASQRAAKEAKAAKDRLKRGGMSAKDLAEDMLRLRDWEAKHEWKAAANVGLFIQHQCKCESVNDVFEGIFRREVHRHLQDSTRYVKVTSSLADLPNETVIQIRYCDVCELCAEEKGWNLAAPTTVWEDPGREHTEAPAVDIDHPPELEAPVLLNEPQANVDELEV